jgi:hypothetical protein
MMNPFTLQSLTMVMRTSLASGVFFSAVVSAQPTQTECDAARAALLSQTTNLASVEFLPRCPNGTVAIRTAVLATRQIANPEVLRVAYIVSGIAADDGLVNAALDVANDASATELARTWALYTAGGQAQPATRMPRPDAPVVGSVDRPCGMNAFSSAAEPAGAPIAPTTLARLHTISLTLFRNSSLPPRVRRMALCANTAVLSLYTPPVLASDIQLTYLCGNRFRLRNRSFQDVDVRWEVYNTTDRGEESIGSATALIPNFDQTFTTELRGTVRLFYNGVLIQTKANGGTVCTTP